MGVSSYLADLVVALSLICVLIGGFVARYRITSGAVAEEDA
jgi:simple sugar transport system permease protein